MKKFLDLNQQHLSLMDYLGHPAGSDLGLKVAQIAKKANIEIGSRDIKTYRYNGKILTYPKYFLDIYFAIASEFTSNDSKTPTTEL